jgi:uncharacterized protein YtpQ (UPF0354 family)
MGLFSNLFNKKQPVIPAAESGLIVDLTKVVPRVKAVFGGDIPDPHPHPNPESEHVQLSNEDSPVFETFATGLGIFYAVDMGNSYQLIQNRHLSATITQEALHTAALTNMIQEVADRTEVHGDPSGTMMLTNGGNFEAAMLLADGIWENLKDVFKDDICVAVPARDLLFIAAKNNPTGRDGLRAVVRKFFDEQETVGLLVRHIYAREGNKWIAIETA